jgi:hypothetical protein
MVFFFGTLAFGADVCRALPVQPAAAAPFQPGPSGRETGPSDRSTFADTPRPLSFRLSVKPGGPEFRITVRPLLFDRQSVDSSFKAVHGGDIVVARCQDGAQLQVLPIMAWQRINFAAAFHAYDINFDGYLDFAVLTEFGATWGSLSWWVYDPGAGRFIQNEFTSELRKIASNGADVDPKEREITAHHLVGGGVCGDLPDRYRIEDNRLIHTHEEEISEAHGSECTVKLWDLVAGSMVVTGSRRYVDGKPVEGNRR